MALVKCIAIHDKPKATIKYILNKEKTKDGALTTGINILKDPNLADKKMKYYRNKYKSSNKVKAMHVIHSFSDAEEITPEKAHEISLEWYKSIFPSEALAIVATHIKRENVSEENCLHTHFLINNVCRDGEKIRTDKEFIKRAIEVSNDICKKHGLKHSFIKFDKVVPDKSYHEWQNEKQGKGWKQKIREDIDVLIMKKNTFEDVLDGLKDMGYEVKVSNKNISVRPPNKERFVRLKTLGSFYTKEQIDDRILKYKFPIKKIVKKYNNNWIDRDVYKFKNRKGTIGNILEIAALIIKEKIGINSDEKYNYKRSYKRKAEKELILITEALNYIDKYNITSSEEVVKMYQETELKIIKLNKWKAKAENTVNEVKNISADINKLTKIKEKTIEVNKKIEESEEKKKELRKIAEAYDNAIKEHGEEVNKFQENKKNPNKER